MMHWHSVTRPQTQGNTHRSHCPPLHSPDPGRTERRRRHLPPVVHPPMPVSPPVLPLPLFPPPLSLLSLLSLALSSTSAASSSGDRSPVVLQVHLLEQRAQ
eukprot:761398-Hanusia_phi.AAC.4